MSHVIVGERLAGMNPEMVGHVVKGAGHFIETINGWVQSGAPNMTPITTIAQKSINDLSKPISADAWQWQQLNNNFGRGAFVASSGTPDYLKGIDFTLAGQEKTINFSQGINFSTEKKLYAFGLDMHYNGPGSEAEQVHEHYRDQQNKEAFDRVRDGSQNPQDQQRANEWVRDHSA